MSKWPRNFSGKRQKPITLSDDLKRYECAIYVWTRMDETFEGCFNMYLFTMGLLLVAYSQIQSSNIKALFSITGIIISIIWIFVLHRLNAEVFVAEKVARSLEAKIFHDSELDGGFFTSYELLVTKSTRRNKSKWLCEVFKKRSSLVTISSSKIYSFYIPLLMIILWFTLSILPYITYVENAIQNIISFIQLSDLMEKFSGEIPGTSEHSLSDIQKYLYDVSLYPNE